MFTYKNNTSLHVLYTAPQVQENVKKAMEHWEKHTCVRFSPYSEKLAGVLGHDDFIDFFKGNGCYSFVGRVRNGKQEISVGTYCDDLGTMAHELGHALGFYHEQSRPDRDFYVEVKAENIKPGKEGNFEMYSRSKVSDENIPYDLGSIMHYGDTEFATNKSIIEGKATLVTKDKEMQNVIGQRLGLSFYDIKTANELYKCNEHCESHIQCENGGFIGPDCNCKCPEGLGGPYCTDVAKPSGMCGGVYETCQGTIQTPNWPDNYLNETTCYWFIKAPRGSSIEVTFSHFNLEDDILHGRQKCGYDWVEIRKFGPEKVGPRYCGNQLHETTATYNVSSLLIKFSSDDSYTYKGFQATYRVIQKRTGSWGPYSAWSQCPVSCGGGIQVRMRSCLPSGTICSGKDLDFRKCNEHPCHEEI
ncbi:blastula protease 10 isoform X1 [Lingula anatina]|uniref:Metalloendopeptidase n=2 Tax=Lingula anatina TaxID=7574 RepID=A0A2R2MMC4_LINAN|nr:blastula protease 10 isoform X1 [Lingula anatina]|eukprot:XP_023931349.1 blastula protease 10 isoform X1 [Lingula anatina]